MTKSEIRIIQIVILVSVLLRIGGALFLGDQVTDLPGTADQLSYHNLALRVLGGHGFTFGQDWWPATPANAQTAHWSFLYTFYLVLVYGLFGVHPLAARLIQAVIVGVFQPLLAYLLGKQLFSSRVGLVSAGITAVYIYFIYYAGALMTESFYITAILGGLWLAMRIAGGADAPRKSLGQAAALGLLFGSAILLRQLFLLFVPFLALWMAWAGRRLAKRIPLREVVVACIVIAAMILPFTVFNTLRFGHFVLLNTNAGFAFFWGNNPVYGTQFVPLLPDYHALIPKQLLSLDEAALDQALLKLGLQYVIADPVRYLLLSASRIPVYFMFWPSRGSGLISNVSRVGSFGIFLPFMLYGLVRAFFFKKGDSRAQVLSLQLLVLFVLIYTGIHLATWALIRYRLPVDAALIPLAGLAFVDLWERVAPRLSLARSKPVVQPLSRNT